MGTPCSRRGRAACTETSVAPWRNFSVWLGWQGWERRLARESGTGEPQLSTGVKDLDSGYWRLSPGG